MVYCEKTGLIPYRSAREAWNVVEKTRSPSAQKHHKYRVSRKTNVTRCAYCKHWHIQFGEIAPTPRAKNT